MSTELALYSTPSHLINLLARSFARLNEGRLIPQGLGVFDLRVLVALQNDQVSTQGDLARLLRVAQPSLPKQLTRLQQEGWIQRALFPADGRVIHLALTEVAKARLPDAVAVLLQSNKEALSGFTEAEIAQLINLLGRLMANLDEIAIRTKPIIHREYAW